jgi:ABC-2 type transport system permease protein
VRTLFWKEWLEQRRSYRLLAAVIVLAIAGILGPLTAKYLPQMLASMADVPQGLEAILPAGDISMAVGEYSDNLVQFGALLALLLPMAAIVGEKTQGTAALTLSKPVSRFSFVAAKLGAQGLTLLLAVLTAVAIGYLYVGVLFGWLDPLGFAAANAIYWVYLMVLSSLTILASALARSTVASAGIAFGGLITLGILGGLPPFSAYLPSALLVWGRALALGLPAEPAWAALAVSIVLSLTAVALAWQVLLRQEL